MTVRNLGNGWELVEAKDYVALVTTEHLMNCINMYGYIGPYVVYHPAKPDRTITALAEDDALNAWRANEEPTEYEHLYSIVFSLTSFTSDASDVTSSMLQDGLIKRIASVTRSGDWLDACGAPFETVPLTDE